MTPSADQPALRHPQRGPLLGTDPPESWRPGPRVVAFGGGTGMSNLLVGLKERAAHVTAVVTVTDNGGSSGRLRNEFDMLPPGDLRNCLLALADVDPLIGEVFQYRFQEPGFGLKGHCFGNLFIAVLAKIVGSFDGSILELNRLLRVRGRVLPAASAKVSLVARHPDGTKSTGEVQISRSGKPIERVELRPGPVPVSAEIVEAVKSADLFVFGPGSLFTSVLPNLLLDGLPELLRENGSPCVYIANLMTQPGETDGFRLSDHVRALRNHVGGSFPDYVLAHEGTLPDAVESKYRAQGAVPVESDVDAEVLSDVQVLSHDLHDGSDAARHDPQALADLIDDELLSRISLRTAAAAAAAAATSPGRDPSVARPSPS